MTDLHCCWQLPAFAICVVIALVALSTAVASLSVTKVSVLPTSATLDYGLVAGTSDVNESPATLSPNVMRLLAFGTSLTHVDYSTTSDPLKFDVTQHAPTVSRLVYTPTFTNSIARLTGTIAASIDMQPGVGVTLVETQFGIGWSTDNFVTTNVITSTVATYTLPPPGFFTLTIPFAVSWTRAQLGSSPVTLALFIQVPTSTGTVTYRARALSILATEM